MGSYVSLCACRWIMGSPTFQQTVYKVKTPCWVLGHVYQDTLAASYQILVGYQDWGVMGMTDLDKGEYFIIGVV